MPTLRDSAVAFKGKKEITDLASIPVDVEFKTGSFKNSEDKVMSFNFIEIDGYKYTIKAKLMQQIQNLLNARPATKNIKVQKGSNGDLFVIPLD